MQIKMTSKIYTVRSFILGIPRQTCYYSEHGFNSGAVQVHRLAVQRLKENRAWNSLA
jgi:hypothetical protein